MTRRLLLLVCVVPLMLGQLVCAPTDNGSGDQDKTPPPIVKNPRVRINIDRAGTSEQVVVELFPVQAPLSTANFLRYVREGFYTNTIVHFASASDGIRGGRYLSDLTAKQTHDPIKNESSNGLQNRRRYLAMIRGSDPDSAKSEFTIYTGPASSLQQLDYSPPPNEQIGQTVFGQVVDGMGAVDTIAGVVTGQETAGDNRNLTNLPTDTITITGMTIVSEQGSAPTLTCPADVTAVTTGELTQVALGHVSATDPEDGALTVKNDAPTNGFKLGKTKVNYWATDTDGNVVACVQTVTIREPGKPTINCPADVNVLSTGELTVVDIGTATATDEEDGTLTPTNNAPANGFPVGTTSVVWTATDSAGNTATCTQSVKVRLPGKPQITCPPDVTAVATGPLTPVTLGQATATDDEDGTLTPTNDAPADGFPLGDTIVTWRAVDSANNVATCQQKVTVKNPSVQVTTSKGLFVIELLPADAPQTVANFLRYVNEEFYSGMIFHRVIADFVVQTGGFLPDGTQPATHDPVVNEFKDSNVRATVAMAKRGDDPNSATSQWFVNLADNSQNLDNQNGGFTVFGRVTQGMESVVDVIAQVPVDSNDKPLTDVLINSVTVLP
jgi:cyclophilin family peptidyl-prolyl cis-trans isomerase